eukprot:762947-Hanusia_phi.AAC.4
MDRADLNYDSQECRSTALRWILKFRAIGPGRSRSVKPQSEDSAPKVPPGRGCLVSSGHTSKLTVDESQWHPAPYYSERRRHRHGH